MVMLLLVPYERAILAHSRADTLQHGATMLTGPMGNMLDSWVAIRPAVLV